MHKLAGWAQRWRAGAIAATVAACPMTGCASKLQDSHGDDAIDTGPVCAPWTESTLEDPAFASDNEERSSGSNGYLSWYPVGFFLQTNAMEALGWSTREAPMAVDVTYDALGTTSLETTCEPDPNDWECGVTIDCWAAASGTITLVGELLEFQDSDGEDSCCEGELAVDMQSIVFEGGPTIYSLQTQVFVETYNAL